MRKHESAPHGMTFRIVSFFVVGMLKEGLDAVLEVDLRKLPVSQAKNTEKLTPVSNSRLITFLCGIAAAESVVGGVTWTLT